MLVNCNNSNRRRRRRRRGEEEGKKKKTHVDVVRNVSNNTGERLKLTKHNKH